MLQSPQPGISITVHLKDNGDFIKAKIESYKLKPDIPLAGKKMIAYSIINDLSLQEVIKNELCFQRNGTVIISKEGRLK